MRAAYYTQLGAARDVLRLGELDTPVPGPGDIRVRVRVSGINPSDWKARLRGRGGGLPFPMIIPHSDGAGVVDAVGDGVDTQRVGQRVWVMNAQWKRPFGTAAEYVVLPQKYVIPLPDGVDLADAACFGIPFLTAHRAITFDGEVRGQTLLSGRRWRCGAPCHPDRQSRGCAGADHGQFGREGGVCPGCRR